MYQGREMTLKAGASSGATCSEVLGMLPNNYVLSKALEFLID